MLNPHVKKYLVFHHHITNLSGLKLVYASPMARGLTVATLMLTLAAIYMEGNYHTSSLSPYVRPFMHFFYAASPDVRLHTSTS